MSKVISPNVVPLVKHAFVVLGVPKDSSKTVQFLGYSGTISYRDYDPDDYKSAIVCDYERVNYLREDINESDAYVVGRDGRYVVVTGNELTHSLLNLSECATLIKIEIGGSDEER